MAGTTNMTTTWTPITKASGTSYTKINPVLGSSRYGYALYGTGTYGGTTSWTNISKPTDGVLISAGTATGLLMPPTYSQDIGGIWTKINKAT